jgi:predicted Zn-dependent protease
MNIFRPLIKAISSAAREISGNILGISAWLGNLARQPMDDLKRTIAARSNDQVEKGPRKSLFLLPFTALMALASLLLRILFSPLDLIAALIQGQRKSVLWSLAGSALLAITIAFGVFAYQSSNSYKEAQISQLRKSAATAFRSGSFEEATRHYDQLTTMGKAYDSEKLNGAIAHAKVGNDEKSLQILVTIAPGPGNTPGFDKAHQMLAATIFSQLKAKKVEGPQAIETLRWHLSCSGSDLPAELQVIWAEYYLAIREPDKAVDYLRSAADQKPELLLPVADILQQQGNEFARTEVLKKAVTEYEKLLIEDDTNVKNRITYSKILFDLERYTAAEKALLDGLKLDNKEIQTACASFYVSCYELEIQLNGPLSAAKKLEYLRKALSHDINHLPIYQSIIQFYQRSQNNDDRKLIVNSLMDILEGDSGTGFAHFSLSSIYWIENDIEKSQIHMEEAFKANNSLSVVANNLAWILAHAEEPDLDRAFSIAEQIVGQNPEDGRFRDTLATILMKQKNYSVALTEFQKALPTTKNKSEIHEKMARIYRKLNKVELAVHHEEQAGAN